MKNSEVIPASLKKVPPFPPVAAKLLNLLSSQNVDVADIAELLRNDPALTARLLQHVNSPACGLGQPIKEVRQAITLLGFDRTRQLAVVSATAGFTGGALNLELQSCWQHSVATAVLADEIAKGCGVFLKVAFTAGILHDIGRLGLMLTHPREYTRAVQDAGKRGTDLLDFERETFGIDHAEAGRLLAETWKLPAEFLVIAGRHHDPCEGTELTLLRIVHVACRLADTLGFGMVRPRTESGIQEILGSLPADAAKRLPGSAEELHALVEEHMSQFM